MRSGTGDLELVRWGLRFARDETEQAYRQWHVRMAIPFTRIGMVLSCLSWSIAVLAFWAMRPDGALLWGPPVLLVMLPIMFGSLVITYRPALLPWMLAATMVANVAAGLIGVALSFWVFALPDFAMGAVVVIAYFGFTIFRLLPTQAAGAVLSYLLFDQALLIQAYARGQVGRATLLTCSTFIWMAYVSGLLACIAIVRISRQNYRQERIIADQQRQLGEERAKTELILSEELRHQVAERSRELGEAFARIEAATGVASLAPGDRFGTRYRVVRPLGAGAMGAVYEVERLTDGRRLALKVIPGTISGAEAARMAREAEIGAGLRHANLVSIVDVGIAPGGTPFLVMELVHGGSLEERRARFGDAPWALPILRQIAQGLGSLHDAGVVHRDLKPANVLLADGDDAPLVAKISDFGISRFASIEGPLGADAVALTLPADGPSRGRRLTGTGKLIGTPLYMAPEAAKGAEALGAPADVFAFGTLAYELLTGQLPFAQPAALLALVGQVPPPPRAIDGVAARLGDVVLACLAADPRERPPLRDLLAVLAEEHAPAESPIMSTR